MKRIHHMIQHLAPAAFLVWCLGVDTERACAQDPTVTAAVRPAQVGSGEQFEYSVSVSGTDVGGIRPPKAPEVSAFVLLSGPNQSTSMQWINGSMSASATFSYVLYARQPGKYTIPPAVIEYGGKTLKSQPVQIEITKGSPRPNPQQQQQPAVAASVGDNLLLRAIPDRQRVKRGEQLTVTYKLYSNVEISQVRQKKDPTAEGFWTEDISTATQLSYANETLNGKRYRVAVIRKIALFPTQAGTLTIGPLELTCGVLVRRQRRSNDPFDSFFNDPFFQQLQSVDYDLKSNSLSVSVESLPSGAPAEFSGAVGNMSFNASIDRATVRAGDPVTLRMTVSGVGNVRLVTMPKPSLPGDIEAYEPKISDDVTRDGGVIRGKKVAEYLLVPRNAGERVIEPLTFVYFDPAKNAYVTHRSGRFVITVEQGRETAGGGASLAAKEDVRLLGEDIRFLKLTSGGLVRADESDGSTFALMALLGIPPLVFVGAFVYRRRLEQQRGDMPRLLFQRAGREASKRLKQARALQERGDAAAYHAEVLHALTQYLEHKLHLPPASFTVDEATDRLRNGGVPDDILTRLRSSVERVEYARYAPGTDSTQARKDLLDSATAAIDGIERTYTQASVRRTS